MRIVIVDSEETSREVIKQAINTVVETDNRERTPGSYYHGS